MSQTKYNRLRQMTAALRDTDAKRHIDNGYSRKKAAQLCGYASVDSMSKAIKAYVKSPVPVGAGNGADQNTHHDCTTNKGGAQA